MTALAFSGRAAVSVSIAPGVLIGATVPPLLPVVRALYPQMVQRDCLRALFALDTTAQELSWVVGPLAAACLESATSTAGPLFVSAGVTVIGTVWFLLNARRFRPEITRSRAAFGGVLKSRAVVLAMVASLALVASFMAPEVGIIAALDGGGITAGIAIAVASVGSLFGGLAFGHRQLGTAGLVGALTVVAGGTALFGVAPSLALQLVALFVSGLGFAPALSVLYIMVSLEIAVEATAEAFGWLTSAAMFGGAIGTAIAGAATEAHGPAGAVIASALLNVLAAISPLLARVAGPLHGLTEDAHEGARTE